MIDVQQYLLKEGEVKKKSYAWDLILSPNAKLENVDGKKLQNYSLKSESALVPHTHTHHTHTRTYLIFFR